MKKLVLVLAVCLLLGADKKEDVKKDQDKLQGTWTVVSAELDGNKLPQDQAKGELVFKGDKYSYSAGGETGEGTYKIDPSKKPKTMDAVPADGPFKGQTVEEIYEVEGDELKICLATPGTKRPTDFTAAAGSNRMSFTYKRAKK
jgi:uncharacterized protein (TIGR03067 family)